MVAEKKCCTGAVLIGGLICAGIIFVCLGAASIPLLKDLYTDMLKKQLVLKSGTETFKSWQKPPAPVYMQFYIFNYTNVYDIVNNESKPRVVQLGPYSYRELKVNEVLKEDAYKISYLMNNTYVYDTLTSCNNCSENDTLFAPNTPIITFISKLRGFSPFIKHAINVILTADDVPVTLFKKLTVYKLIWGYEDPFLKQIAVLEEIAKLISVKVPIINPFVALQYNGTKGALLAGNATLLTGKNNVNDVQKIISWKGKRGKNEGDNPFSIKASILTQNVPTITTSMVRKHFKS